MADGAGSEWTARMGPPECGHVRSPNSARTLLGWSEKRFIDAPAAGAGPASGAAVGGPGLLSAAATRGFVVHRSRTNCDTGSRDPSLNRRWNGARVPTCGAADGVAAAACRDGDTAPDARSSGTATDAPAGPLGAARATS